MSGVAGVGGSAPMPLAQANLRAAAAYAQQKPQTLASERANPAKAAPQVARLQAKAGKPEAKADAPEAPRLQSKSLGPEYKAEAFSSTAQALAQRDAAHSTPEDASAAGEDALAAQEALQDKMLRQIVKMKQAYSHIQAHTGDTKAGASLNMVA